jgi:hypothetical protein
MDDKIKVTEARTQSECFLWFHKEFIHLRKTLFHVPNGGNRDPREGAKFKAMGVVAGVSDLIFIHKSRVYVFEFKNANGKGRLSDDQNAFIEAMGVQKVEVWLITSVDYFKEVVEEIIARKEFTFETSTTKDEYFYKTKVFTYLYSLAVGGVVDLASVCEIKNRPKFVRCISDFIEEGFGRSEDFEILFTPDYLAFYKQSISEPVTITYNEKNVI